MGFSTRGNAKVSLLANCKIDQDYHLMNNHKVTPDFEGKRTDFEIIRLSVTGG